ncbi:GTPase-activating protein GYP7 [Ceratobasidium theobromae]|uniref:GTPase-activating protein GYP7 n=1 Tax=Ceratobasidium theobromae TaxID=1582974 RepID=A0A5N5QM32_9AGAM|nr:GTPase-activating protein GYP7 [Ceratobasidium theobromae]
MVSIKPPSPPSETPAERDEQARLIYSKSKVYVHPTAYTRDNIPGFISIVKRGGISPTYFLTWVPESLLGERGNDEWTKFLCVEAEYSSGVQHNIDEEEDAVIIKAPMPKGESYAFSVPLSSIYSAVVQLPTISSWYGSMTFNLVSGTTLQTIHFHDEESRSISQLSPKNRSASGIGSWGGEDLLQRLRSYCHILRSSLQPNLFLFDPSKPDIEAHTMVLFDDDAADLILAQSRDSPIPHHRRPQRPPQGTRSPSGSPTSVPSPRLTPNGSPVPFPNPRYSSRTSVLHETLPSYPPTSFAPLTSPSRTSLLQSFSQLTRATRHAAQQILSHPLAQPIVPHLPSPMQSFVNASGEWAGLLEKGGMGEFESARVYLARWARVVAEEGERARRRESRVVGGSGGGREEGELGVFELLSKSANLPVPKSTRNPKDAIDKETWLGWFDESGRPKISEEEMRKEVFRRGFATMEARRLAWPSVLNVLPWDTDAKTREKTWAEKRAHYEQIKSEWFGNEEVLRRPEVAEERHRVDVDVRRTDRTQPLFALPSDAPNENAAQAASNEHVDRLGTILLNYNFYEKELGYVQGMSDLCAPIYVVCGADEVRTFWCFVEVMDHMKQNFLRDQSGMKKQLLTLQQLVAVMDPELYRHLEKADALNLFFCFRWVLIAFKREFPFDDVLRLWEVLWTNYYTKHFVLFVVLAVLESHRDVIIRYLIEFDEILKYCNDLSMTIELDSTLAQAEVLFLSFQQIVADIDRRQAEQQHSAPSTDGLRRRHGDNRPTSPPPLPAGASEEDRTKAVLNMSLISDHLRELLDR